MTTLCGVPVRLTIPEDERATASGEQLAHNGQTGRILCPAGNGGVWVAFGLDTAPYIGLPAKWLEKIS